MSHVQREMQVLPDRCSLCGRLVLGLAGQDWCVLPWMLDPQVTDDDVLPGSCHVRCLHELGTARIWADAVQEYYCARWPRWRAGVESGVRWRLHASLQARRFHLWRADGRMSSFSFGAVFAVRDGRLWLTAVLGEVGSAHVVPLLAAMAGAAGTDDVPPAAGAGAGAGVGVGVGDVPPAAVAGVGEVPLAVVVAALGLADRYPASVGRLTRRRRPSGGVEEPVDVLLARYPLPLGEQCLRAAHELIRGRL